MPSSPTFADYTRTPERFFSRGMQLLPQDALTEGKSAWLQNMRPYMEGTLTVREGWSEVSSNDLGGPIVSLFRLNDTTPFVSDANAYRRFAMSDQTLNAASVADVPVAFSPVSATVYSGQPVTGVVSAPFASPRPWLYIGDLGVMSKVNADLVETTIGIATPRSEPTGIYSPVEYTLLNVIGVANWVSYGADASNPGAPTNRIATVVTEALYDEGTNPSMVSVALADMTGITPGITLELGGAAETVVVEEVHPAIAPTTIAAIIYDLGGPNGLCTIQPDNSFTQGQIEQASPKELSQRYDAKGVEPPKVTVTRTVDYPVDSLITIGGVENVRVLSVAIGQDGTMSFRCFTNGIFAAGASITGIASFRAYINGVVNISDPAVALELTNTITPPGTDPIVGGIQSPMTGGTRNWGLVGTRTSQPDDYIRFGIKVSSYVNVESVRLLLNVSDDTGTGGADFLHNYYFYEWRQNDLLEAIQASIGAATALVATQQAGAVQQGQVDAFYQDQYGYNATDDAALIAQGTLGIAPVLRTPTQDATNRAAQADNTVTVGSGLSRQLSVGNEQWVVLQCRLGDLTRVGSDETLTLNALNAAAITVQIAGNDPASDPIDVSYSDCYLLGGYGPDVSVTWNPYVYRFRFRSTDTGEMSNFSPPMRGGMKPHRGQLVLAGEASDAVQCDVVDWFRLGGALSRWAYVGTCPNGATPTFTDDVADRQISGGPTVDFNHYQPWPTQDQPRSGTADLAGTALNWVSGDVFDMLWAEGSAIIVNGRATTLFKSPATTTQLHIVESCGSGTVDFSLPEPTKMRQPLPSLWGGPVQDVLFHFACRDPQDPGLLHWSNGNDPDTTRDTNTLLVTSASEPLVNGFFYDGVPYVFSTERLYRIVPTFGGVSPFEVVETACTKGLWCPWAMCNTPYGVVFLSKDGVYITSGGSEAQPLTDPDMRPLFPQDGSIGQTIRNMDPVDFTLPHYLQMSYVSPFVYFDYITIEGDVRTQVFDPRPTAQGWYYDLSGLTGIRTRLSEPGPDTYTGVIGGENGRVYRMDADKITDVETSIEWWVWTRMMHGGDPRPYKQWGDSILDVHPCGSELGITVIPTIDNYNVELDPRVIGQFGTVRDTYIVEVGTGVGGEGVWSRNFAFKITGTLDACDECRPILYLWEPAFRMKQSSIARRATDWEDLGYNGAKFVQGIVIRANTFGQDKTVSVQFDGPNDAPQEALVLTINHNGEQTKAYPLASAGWTPFTAELVRLKGADDLDWALLEWRWVWEPAPELATQWETQYTTFDMPGFLAVFDGVMAYMATADLTFFVEYQDGFNATYTLPHNSGNYRRYHQILQAQKGKAVRFRWTSDEPFRLIKPDCSVRVQPWGAPGGYVLTTPFGGPSRADGAGI